MPLESLFWLAVLLSVVGIVGLPLLLLLIPTDYFVREHRPWGWHFHKPSWWILLLVRNTLALLFLTAGIVMLFTPGQGLLTIFVALWLAYFPGKYELERRLIAIPKIGKAINLVRHKAGKPPLEIPNH